jgi:hypothetical protein
MFNIDFKEIKYNKQIEELNKFIYNYETPKIDDIFINKFVATTFTDLQINDIIYIKFYPHDQKDKYLLYPLFGHINKIIDKTLDKITNNLLFNQNIILSLNNRLFNGFHPCTNNLIEYIGYDYYIYKLVKHDIIDFYISSSDSDDDIEFIFDQDNNNRKKRQKIV